MIIYKSRSLGSKFTDFTIYLVMVLLCFVTLIPFWDTLMLSISRDPSNLSIKILPQGGLTFSSYRLVFESGSIIIGYINTIKRVIIGTVLNIFVTFCAAYPLSKKNMPLRGAITIFITFTMFFSGGLIPSYLLVKKLSLTDSVWALVLPGLTGAWTIFITRNFISSIPDSIEESASIDGANEIIIMLKIIFPLSLPILATVALWSIVGHWNAWFDAMIYIRDIKKQVLQLMLRRILMEDRQDLVSLGYSDFMQVKVTPQTIRAATIMVTIGPIILIYPFLQKYFIKGILVGSIKG